MQYPKQSAYFVSYEDGSFTFSTPNLFPAFSAFEYSSFKYGSRASTKRYCQALAIKVVEHIEDTLGGDGSDVVITGTPSKCVPNAARILAQTTRRVVRSQGFEPSYGSIYQHELVQGDYGNLNLAERELRNREKVRYFDADDFAGKHVIIIDDIRVTGSIEQSTVRLFEDVAVKSITCLSLLQLDPVVAAEYPHLENELNHSAVGNLTDIALLLNNSVCILLTRTIKKILSAKSTELGHFLGQLDQYRVNELYEGIISEGYDKIDEYKLTVRQIENYLG